MMKFFIKDISRVLLVLLLTISLLIGCKSKGKESNEDKSFGTTRRTENKADLPKPDSYIKRIPIYNKFTAIEPLFRFDNDTTYVINFWATWCKPCIKELPYFEELNVASENERVKVVLVSLDFPKKLQSSLVPFVEKQKLKSEVLVLLDGKYNDWIDKVSPDWSGAIPATYIYRGNQNRLVQTPFENTKELSEIVKSFL